MYKTIARVLEKGSRILHGASVMAAHRGIKGQVAAIPEMSAILTRYQASPEAKWTVASNDVANLYHFVRKHAPEKILELGMGIGLSTFAMALALKHEGKGRVTSLEQLDKCMRIAHDLLPETLAPFVNAVHVPPRAFQIPGISSYDYFCGYDWTPPEGERYDMVFLDGPTGWLENDELVALDSGDLYHFLPSLKEGCLVYVDGRRGAVKMAERYLARHYQVIERDSEYTVLRVTRGAKAPGEIVVEDRKLAPLKNIVYFPRSA